MPFVNYPPSLKDLFDDISNRVRKLETAQRFTAPNVATDPSNTRNGDIWLNTTSNAVNYIDGTGAVQTFTPPPYVAGKNAIINGGFDIWQRGASFTNPSGVYFADRWWVQIGGAMTFSQETTTVPTGAKNCMKVVSATALTFNINQPIETFNAIQYAGKTVTLSVQTQTSIVMPLAVQLFYSTTVDNAPGGTWTAITATSGATFNGTVGSFTQNNATYAVPSTAKSLMVLFGTNGAPSGGYTLYVGQVQLELGSTATTFSRAGGSIGGELALCQRYYETSYPVGIVLGSTGYSGNGIFANVQALAASTAGNVAGVGGMPFNVRKRATPTVQIWDFYGNSGGVRIEPPDVTRTGITGVTCLETGAIQLFTFNASSATAVTLNYGFTFNWAASAEL